MKYLILTFNFSNYEVESVFLSILAFLFLGKCLSAQNTGDTSHSAKEFYKRGKIKLGEKKIYVIKNIVIEKDSVLFTDV